MIPAERQQRIRALIAQTEDIVRMDDMAQQLGISRSTLRRDLQAMVKQGEVQLLRGGAVRHRTPGIELCLDAKMRMNYDEKSRIAHKAAELIEDHEVIFLDPSSVNALLIPLLKGRDVTVVTNSIAHINQLEQHGLSGILIGGEIKSSTSSCIGPIAEQMLRELHFTHCFLGANGMSVQYGLTNHDLRERNIKRIAITNSAQPVFLIDSTKFDVVAMCQVARIDDYPIITDRRIEQLAVYDNIITAD